LIDGSFFENGEIPGRDMSEIPHPFIVESMEVLRDVKDKSRIHFIHFNHTNPVLNQDSSPRKDVLNAGFNIAGSGQKMSI
jgi:pyrroloquinoline quinone biosynthesis protein B